MRHTEAENCLQKAKIQLFAIMPFFAFVGLQLKQRFDDSVKTACVDGVTILYNTAFFMNLTPAMRVFLVAHEICHVVYLHFLRVGSRNAVIWNKAADYVINHLLVKAGMTMPTVGLYDDRFAGMFSEQVYDILMAEGCPDDDFGDYIDLIEPKNDPDSDPMIKDKVKQILVRAKAMSDMQMPGGRPGTIPEEVRILIDNLLHPTLPWYVILRNHLTATSKTRSDWKRRNRRSQNVYLPSRGGRTIGNVVIANDTSCSVTDFQQKQIVSEIEGLRLHYKVDTLTILDCDTEIHNVHKVKPRDKILDLAFDGRGGTSYKPVEEYCDKNRPDLLIYFTDLEIDDEDDILDKKPYQIIWINYGDPRQKAHTGVTVPFRSASDF